MKKKRPIFSLLLIILTSYVFADKSSAQKNVQIIEANYRRVVFQFEPIIDRLDTLIIKNDKYLRINCAGMVLSGEVGQPLMPIKKINIGVPLQAEVTAKILSIEFANLSGKIAPAPFFDMEGNCTFEPKAEAYQNKQLFPADVLAVEPMVFVRDQRVVPITINGLQFQPDKNEIHLIKKIVVQLDISGDVSPTPRDIDLKDEEFYEGLIINYAISKDWLKKHQPKVSKKTNSMDAGPWYKIFIEDEGMYKISGVDLVNKGIALSTIDAKSLRLYNNGGTELPRDMKMTRPDSLIENAILVVGEEDGKFDESDYILFYGRPVNFWKPLSENSSFYEHYINHYTEQNIYWLTWGNGKTGARMKTKVSAAAAGLDVSYNFWGRYFFEDEINNFLHSGLDWFGRLMAGSQDQRYSMYLPNASNAANNVFLRLRALGVTSGTHRFNLFMNNQQFASFTFSGNQLFTYETSETLPLAESGYNSLKIQYNGDTPESQVYLDWLEISYRKQYLAENNFLWFSQQADGVQKYRITNFASNNIEVFDVTDWSDIKRFSNAEIVSGTVTVADEESGFPRHQYIAVSSDAYRSPVKIEQVERSHWRSPENGADFIIITHGDFYQAVQPLKQQREQKDNLKTEVVKIFDIYNEFSCGLVDVTAIRDFVKFAYENWHPAPRYVLLCGDGDYDYKNIKADADKNWLPPYQTNNDFNENTSRTSDDWFVTVSGYDSSPDLAIGRFPVQSAEETENVVEKILHYENAPYWVEGQSSFLDDWRNVATMVGDDEFAGGSNDNETIHTRDAENIIERYIPNSMDKVKIYLIDYPAEKDPSTSGIMKPAATEALIARINKGTLLLNYVGHGAPSLWAHERVLKESRDFDRIQNENKLPFWLAATCDFGRFDDPFEQGFAEKLFTSKGRGGIAFLTSARLAYATDNTALNREFFSQLFNSEESTQRIGVALFKAKNLNYSSTNDQKYHLYGDPTMRLALPDLTAKITALVPDTLKALSEIKVTGELIGQDIDVDNFEGLALLKVADSRQKKTYLTEKQSAINYVAAGNTIFKGTIVVNRGNFSGKFFVPKDISYGGKLGRVSVYFANGNQHGIGYRDSLLVGGTSFLADAEGPIIKIGFQGQNYADGNMVAKKSVLEVEIADSTSGVNIVGDIGHNITMVLDDNENEKIVLTDYFNYFEGNHKAGKVIYDFSTYKSSVSVSSDEVNTAESLGLPEGEHKITIKAWDNFNNSSRASTFFSVLPDDELKIKNVLNFPNPFSSNTTFTFVVSQACNIKIKIYTVRGTLIQTLDNLIGVAGLNQINWDGRDREGDWPANGVYLYKIIATTQTNEKTVSDESIGKLVFAR